MPRQTVATSGDVGLDLHPETVLCSAADRDYLLHLPPHQSLGGATDRLDRVGCTLQHAFDEVATAMRRVQADERGPDVGVRTRRSTAGQVRIEKYPGRGPIGFPEKLHHLLVRQRFLGELGAEPFDRSPGRWRATEPAELSGHDMGNHRETGFKFSLSRSPGARASQDTQQ